MNWPWISGDANLQRQIDDLKAQVGKEFQKVSVDTTALAADMTALKGLVTTAVTDFGTLSNQISDLKAQLAAGNTDAATQAAVDAIDAEAKAIVSTLQTGLAAIPTS